MEKDEHVLELGAAMKRAIYFDDRERDLARRVFDHVDYIIKAKIEVNAGATVDFALKSTRIEITALAAKFAEKDDGA